MERVGGAAIQSGRWSDNWLGADMRPEGGPRRGAVL